MVELLNKALASIEQERHAAIRQKWMAVRYEFGLRWRDLLFWAGTIALIAIAVIALIYRANRRLSGEIAERLRVEGENRELIENLQHALAENRNLHGILPLCSHCKKIRTEEGTWEEVDIYIDKHSQADVSHGICPDCLKIHYPEYQVWKKRSST